jgi:uncharacterized protein (DUF736 family)
MIVGQLEPKKNKETGKVFFDLSMNIPFLGKQSFYVVANDKKTAENSPDYKVFCGGNVSGAIWKKISNAGEEYHSGSVFCLGMPLNRLHFAIFKTKDETKKDESGNPIRVVVISEGERKDGNAEDQAPDETVF